MRHTPPAAPSFMLAPFLLLATYPHTPDVPIPSWRASLTTINRRPSNRSNMVDVKPIRGGALVNLPSRAMRRPSGRHAARQR
ncbi:hypothetical protein D0U05_29125 [Burkholderia pseudomallei]|nr:hypothetical protein D0U05_29125 [Burkholderia pseudomallei]